MDPPMPMSVAKEDRRVMMGAHTPAPARESAPAAGIITYINAVNDAVHNVDELSEHKRDGYPEHQSWYGIISKIIDMLLLCFHSSPLVDKLA